MIRGVGTDIVKVCRVDLKYLNRILSDDELALYDTFSSESRRQEFVAARFAAKEALTKAFTATKHFFAFTEMTILNDDDGRPFLKSPQLPEFRIWLSLSHEHEYAIALCVIEDAVNDAP
ncbi:MAG: holo-ACP synthase [Candidatus Izemoplasmatales bacterium]|jgi:holo-[acyl-carrier protein] synthase|nr:holo-ACP synthase [Acholeplasmataceae bacterium]